MKSHTGQMEGNVTENRTMLANGMICLLVPCFWLLFTCSAAAERFVELNTEIEIDDWSYWIFEDTKGIVSRNGERPESIFGRSTTTRFVVGTNSWMMEGDFYKNAKATRWFTGTNIIERSIITAPLPNPLRITNFPVGISPPVGEERTKVQASADGNPGRPVRVSDLFELRGKIGWLAFCSGPALKRSGREIFPLDDLWKERCLCSGVFTDMTAVFDDSLGLPKSMEIFTETGRLIFQYQVRQSTNVLGWNFPVEFYIVQYGPGPVQPPGSSRTNSWEVHFTAKGRITNVNVREQPSIRAELPLTPIQARELAQSLANDKAQTAYNCRPFRSGSLPELVQGRWLWHDRRGYARYDVEATVTFAANGANPDVHLVPIYTIPLLHER